VPLSRPVALAALLPALACTGSTTAPAHPTPAATSPAITTADLRARLSIYADDSMQGRKAGTPGNVKATDYLAAQARRIGLEPAGAGVEPVQARAGRSAARATGRDKGTSTPRKLGLQRESP